MKLKYTMASDLYIDIQLGVATLKDLKDFIEDQWQDGYDTGHSEGYDEGFDDGRD